MTSRVNQVGNFEDRFKERLLSIQLAIFIEMKSWLGSTSSGFDRAHFYSQLFLRAIWQKRITNNNSRMNGMNGIQGGGKNTMCQWPVELLPSDPNASTHRQDGNRSGHRWPRPHASRYQKPSTVRRCTNRRKSFSKRNRNGPTITTSISASQDQSWFNFNLMFIFF